MLLLILELPLRTEGRGSFMLVPGLCPCVYLYLMVLNESAVYKVYQDGAVKSALNKHNRGNSKMLHLPGQKNNRHQKRSSMHTRKS